MNQHFTRALADLRREKGVSQRQAAKDLAVSQALLSHYENGVREPGLAFVVRACDYYGVSADYLLGRSDRREPPSEETLPAPEDGAALSRALLDAARRDPALADLLRRMAGQVLDQLQ